MLCSVQNQNGQGLWWTDTSSISIWASFLACRQFVKDAHIIWSICCVSTFIDTVYRVEFVGVCMTEVLHFTDFVYFNAASRNPEVLKCLQTHKTNFLTSRGSNLNVLVSSLLSAFALSWIKARQFMSVAAFDKLVDLFMLEKRDKIANCIDWKGKK